MASKEEVSHKEIYERLLTVEQKVDSIDVNTKGLVKAFQAAEGAFTVLEWVAKAVKPLIVIGAFFGAFFGAIYAVVANKIGLD